MVDFKTFQTTYPLLISDPHTHYSYFDGTLFHLTTYPDNLSMNTPHSQPAQFIHEIAHFAECPLDLIKAHNYGLPVPLTYQTHEQWKVDAREERTFKLQIASQLHYYFETPIKIPIPENPHSGAYTCCFEAGDEIVIQPPYNAPIVNPQETYTYEDFYQRLNERYALLTTPH